METKQHRATADYFFSRHILLHDVGFGEVLDVVKFEFPVQNKHAQSAKYVGPLQHMDVDWTLSLTPCIKVGFSGQREEINFEEVLDRWTREHDARFAWKEFVVTKSFVDEESGEHRWTKRTIATQRCMVVHLPLVVMDLVLVKSWHVIGIAIHTSSRWPKRMRFLGQDMVRQRLELEKNGFPEEPRPSEFVTMTQSLFEAAANLIRNQPLRGEWNNQEVVANASQVDHAHVLHWLDSMAAHIEGGTLSHLRQTAHMTSVSTAFKIEPLIISIKLSGLLRSGKTLPVVVRSVAQLLGYSDDWMDESLSVVPSRTTLLRHRFTLDAALAKLVCSKLQTLLESGMVAAFLCDSSPRQGREWMFSEMFAIKKKDLGDLLMVMKSLWRKGRKLKEELQQWRDRGLTFDDISADDQHDRAAQKDMIRSESLLMQKLVWHHVFVPCTMGARNMSTAAKFQTVLHQLRLESFDWDQVGKLTKSYYY